MLVVEPGKGGADSRNFSGQVLQLGVNRCHKVRSLGGGVLTLAGRNRGDLSGLCGNGGDSSDCLSFTALNCAGNMVAEALHGEGLGSFAVHGWLGISD